MKKLLVTGLILSSLVLSGCFKQEPSPEIQKQVQTNTQSGGIDEIKTDTGNILDNIEKGNVKVVAVSYGTELIPGFKGSVFNDNIRIIKNGISKEILAYNSEYFKNNNSERNDCMNSVSFNSPGNLSQNGNLPCKHFEKFIDINGDYLFYKVYGSKDYGLVVMNLKTLENIAYFPHGIDFSKFDVKTDEFIVRLSLSGPLTFMRGKISDLNNKVYIFDLFRDFTVEMGTERGFITVDGENPEDGEQGTDSGAISESGSESDSGFSLIDNSKEFSIDDYFTKGSYSITQKFEKEGYTILTINPNVGSGEINNDFNKVTCMDNASSYCVNFILKDNKILYSNLQGKGKFDYKSIKEDLGGVYKIGKYGVIFANSGGDGMPDNGTLNGSSLWHFTYINFKDLNKIYEDYTENLQCNTDKNGHCIESTKKTTTTKYFYNISIPAGIDTRQKLNLKATNIEDAYFEYYKENKDNSINNTVDSSYFKENIINLLKSNKQTELYNIDSKNNEINIKNIKTGKVTNVGEYNIGSGYVNNNNSGYYYKKIEHGYFWNTIYSNDVKDFNINDNYFALLGELSYMNEGFGVGHIFYGENKKSGFTENRFYELNLSISESECPFNGQILIEKNVIYTGPLTGEKCGGCTEISAFDLNSQQFLFRTNQCDVDFN